LRQRVLYNSYLDSEKDQLIRQISKTMRHNNIGFDIDEPYDMPGDNGTKVEWAEVPSIQGNSTKMKI